jgi:hypothetical protein
MDPNIILYKLQKYQNKLKSGTGDIILYNAKIQFYQKYLLEGGTPLWRRRGNAPIATAPPALLEDTCIRVYPAIRTDPILSPIFDIIIRKLNENQPFSQQELKRLSSMMNGLQHKLKSRRILIVSIKNIQSCIEKKERTIRVLKKQIYDILNQIIYYKRIYNIIRELEEYYLGKDTRVQLNRYYLGKDDKIEGMLRKISSTIKQIFDPNVRQIIFSKLEEIHAQIMRPYVETTIKFPSIEDIIVGNNKFRHIPELNKLYEELRKILCQNNIHCKYIRQ